MILPELIPFLKSVDAKPKKKLSQNFLTDRSIVKKIVETAEVSDQDCVLEIGPGPGALTKELLDRGAKVIAVEMDSTFAKELRRFQTSDRRLEVYEYDFLKFPLRNLPQKFKVVANLPYHITTPILEKLFQTNFESITIMVQKEVADRMMAASKSKTFGSLSIFVQFYSKYHSSFIVPPTCFYPQPKVDSTVIRLDKTNLPNIDTKLFFQNVHLAFQQRRKMLSSTLPYPKDLIRRSLAAISIREDARPEDLSLDQWILFFSHLQNPKI
jgi:16S rRNA (adenine1518-N6/adenine1519-N6)-dimethyltransferase